MILSKPVYLNDIPLGHARTWDEVAIIAHQFTGREQDGATLSRTHSEGRDGFFLNASLLQGRQA